MTKSKSQFAALSEQDRQHILDLCARHSYDEAVIILARPRPEGLNIVTSKSALCRFFTASHPAPAQVLLAQYAAAVQIQSELHANSFLGAIRATVQARVFQNLTNGKALADMDEDFRLLKSAETLYLADAKWRAAHPKEARAAYHAHVEHCAKSSDIDFTPLDESGGQPTVEPSQFEEDVRKARQEQQLVEKHRQRLLATLKAAGYGPEKDIPLVSPDLQDAESSVIPHIPPDSTSAEGSPHAPLPPPAPAAGGRIPYLGQAPK